MTIKSSAQNKLARALGDQPAAAEFTDAIDASTALLDATPGTVEAEKALVPDANSALDALTITKVTAGVSCTNAGVTAVVGGGNGNTASGDYSVVVGGNGNTASGDYSVAAGVGNAASGSSSVVAGGLNIASTYYSTIVGGAWAVADKYGQEAFASGRFTDGGDAQRSTYIARALVDHDDSDWHDLFLDGTDDQMVIPTDAVWTFRILLVGTSVGCAKSFSFIIEGMIENDGDTTAIKASTVTTVYDTDDTDFDAQVVADDTGIDALVIQVTDATSGGDVVRWVANIETVEVTFPAA